MERGWVYVRRTPEIIGYNQIQTNPSLLFRASLAEFFGTLFLVFVWTGAALSTFDSRVAYSLAIGFIVASMVKITETVSGGHLNPAVTIGFLVTGQINLLRAIAFFIVQILGGIAGSAMLKVISRPENSWRDNGLEFNSTAMTPNFEQIDPYQTLGIEFLSSTILVLTVLTVRDENKREIELTGAALVIGVTMSACHLAFISYAGLSMNPSRSLGPAVLTGIWDHHWIYWVGPLTGGIVAAILHLCVFRGPNLRNSSQRNVGLEVVEVVDPNPNIVQQSRFQETSISSEQIPKDFENLSHSTPTPIDNIQSQEGQIEK